MPRLVRTVCPHDCPDQCSLLVQVEDGRAIKVMGDPDHPFTHGFLCAKVNCYEERVHSPERLLQPMRRVGAKGEGRFAPISWEDALTEITGRWQRITAQHGAQAIAGYTYSGCMGLVSRQFHQAFYNALGATRVRLGTICDSTCEAGWEYSVGSGAAIDPERVVDSDLIIAWGANLVTTNVHMVPFIDQARKKGARLIAIDPYRTRTARRADLYLPIRIGTDTALALGMMHVLHREGLTDKAYLGRYTLGWDQMISEVLPHYTPERVAEITGLAAVDIETLARQYGKARAPFIRLGMGMSRNTGGGMAVRTVALLPGVVGAWHKPGGGALLETAGAWSLNYDALRRPDLAPAGQRFIDQMTLGRDLLASQDPPILSLLVQSSNPATSSPDQASVRAALAREDLFLIVHDTFLTDTGRYADLLLPAPTAFEHEDIYRSYGSLYLQKSNQVLPLQGECRTNFQLLTELARRLGLQDPVFSKSPDELMRETIEVEDGPQAGLRLADLEHGAWKTPLPAIGHNLENAFGTPSGRLEFYSRSMLVAGQPPLPEWRPDAAAEAEGSRWPLRLLTAPGHFQHHTSWAGVSSLRRKEGVAACLLHPDDAVARGIHDGAPVLLHNDRGEVGLYAQVTSDTQRGVVVVVGARASHEYLQGGPINVLTSARKTDFGEGATYQSVWLDVRPLA